MTEKKEPSPEVRAEIKHFLKKNPGVRLLQPTKGPMSNWTPADFEKWYRELLRQVK